MWRNRHKVKFQEQFEVSFKTRHGDFKGRIILHWNGHMTKNNS